WALAAAAGRRARTHAGEGGGRAASGRRTEGSVMGQAQERPGHRRGGGPHPADPGGAARVPGPAGAAVGGGGPPAGGGILEGDAALGALRGYAPAALRGRRVLELVAPEARDDLARRAATGGGEPYRTVGLHRDGTRLELELRARSVGYDGRTVRVTA